MKTPKTRDGEATRSSVLNAAEQLFSENGFSGTSIRKISNASGISDGLILHHFKTKEELYRQVRERLADQYGEALQVNLKFSDDIPKMMRETMETSYRHFKENENYRRIALWSYLEGREDFAQKEMDITKKMMEMAGAAQKMGVLRDDLEPAFFSVIIKGSVDYWIRWESMFAEAMGAGEEDPALDQKFFEQLMGIITKK